MEWSKQELKILKSKYPQLGSKCIDFLENRTIDAIEHEARRQGIKYSPVGEGRAGYLDIESSGLQGDFNFMLTWCIKEANSDNVYWSAITPNEIKNGILDKRIIKELIRTLKGFKTIYTFYGTNFDIKFARTRALYHGLDFVPYGLVQHKDLYYLVKRILRIHSNRLESTADLLDISGKTHLHPRIWVQATGGNPKAIGYILDHNVADVKLLEAVHKKLMDYEGRTKKYV